MDGSSYSNALICKTFSTVANKNLSYFYKGKLKKNRKTMLNCNICCFFKLTKLKSNSKYLTLSFLCSWRNLVLVKQPQYVQVNYEISVNYGAIQKKCTHWKGEGDSTPKVYKNVKWEMGLQRVYTPLYFFKPVFSHLRLFLFFTSLMRKGKL